MALSAKSLAILSSVATKPKSERNPPGASSRAILNIIRQKGHLTRPAIWELIDRTLIPTRTKLSHMMRQLVKQQRIKAFLAKGKIHGQDHYYYKLNPTKRRWNFPDIYGTKMQRKHLQYDIKRDTSERYLKLVSKMPAKDNAEIAKLRRTIHGTTQQLSVAKQQKKQL